KPSGCCPWACPSNCLRSTWRGRTRRPLPTGAGAAAEAFCIEFPPAGCYIDLSESRWVRVATRRGATMYLRMAKRLLLETDKRLLWKRAWNMGWKGRLSVERHKRRLKRGEFFPPFLYVSIINSCNLRCQGCWVDVAARQEIIQPDAFRRLVREAK